MQDIRPLLRQSAHSIVNTLQEGESLASKVAKEASQKGYNELNVRNLIKEANQAYRAIRNADDFDLVTIEDVYDCLHSTQNVTKVAYAHPEYDTPREVIELLEKSASVSNVKEEGKSEFKYIFRELARKSAGEAKGKRANAYLDSKDLYNQASANISVLKTLGFTDSELCSSLVSIGLEPSSCKYASDIYNSLDKKASLSVDRRFHNTEGFLLGVKETLTKFSSTIQEYKEADSEYNRTAKIQKITYNQQRILM